MSPHSFSIERFHPWNGEDMGIIPFFLNHSCESNAHLTFSQIDWEMILTATVFIKAGEEITLDYTVVEVTGDFIPCNCPSPKCRGSFPVNRRKL
jgi:SET domain-containing protein